MPYNRNFVLPSSRPTKFHFVIVNSGTKPQNKIDFTQWALNAIKAKRLASSSSSDLYYVLKQSQIDRTSKLYVIPLCPFCKLVEPTSLRNPGTHHFDGLSTWYVFQKNVDTKKLIDFNAEFHECKLPTKNLQLWENLTFVETFSKVWLSILGNYSIIIDSENRIICQNGQLKKIKATTIKELKKFASELRFRDRIGINLVYNYFPITHKNSLGSVSFVGCGSPFAYPLRFSELVGVFDKYIWLTLFILILLLVLVLMLVNGNSNMTITAFEFIQIILEHSGVFFILRTNLANYRPTFSLVLLSALVLSSAYKYKNMYNLLSPRKPIPYDTINQLIQDKFNIYTRLIYDPFTLFLLFTQAEENTLVINEHKMTEMKFEVFTRTFVESEVSSILSILGFDDSKTRFYLSAQKVFNQLEMLYNHTGFHPKTIELIKNTSVSYNMTSWSIDEQINKTEILLDIGKYAFENANNLLIHELRLCKNTAIILPYKLCLEQANILSNDNAFVGKQSIFEFGVGTFLTGHINPYILKRIILMDFAGIWDIWDKRLMDGARLGRKMEKRSDRRATMSGNVLVVYIVWVGGQFLSTFVFFVEIWLRFC